MTERRQGEGNAPTGAAPAAHAAPPAPAPPAVDAAAAASVRALAFLVGTWRSEADGQLQSEQWQPPLAGTMVGTFLWAGPDGRVRMLEFMTIAPEGAAVWLRLRHFGADLVAREERDAPLRLELASAAGGPEGGNARFVLRSGSPSLSAIEYERRADQLRVTISFTAESGRPPIAIDLSAVR